MNSNPLVCICIPTFNAESTIAQTLTSLLNQSYNNYIIKVFDNCSTDRTCDIIRDFQQTHANLTLIQNENNIGGEGNFTKCLQNGEGKFTAIFHADDIYHPQIIEKQVEAFNQNDIIAVAVHANEINTQGKISGQRFIPHELKQQNLTLLDFNQLWQLSIKYGNFITCPSVMAKTEVYRDQIKIWNGEKFKTSADLDVWLRLAQIGNIAFISEALINYRVAQASYSYNLKQIRTYRHDMFLVLDHYIHQGYNYDQDYFEFLQLKDLALREFNSLKKKSTVIHFSPWKINLLKLAIRDFYHFKMYTSSVAIWILSHLFGR